MDLVTHYDLIQFNRLKTSFKKVVYKFPFVSNLPSEMDHLMWHLMWHFLESYIQINGTPTWVPTQFT